MVKTIKLRNNKFKVTDSEVYFWRNAQGTWEVYDAGSLYWVATDLDTLGWAECVAFEYVCKVA